MELKNQQYFKALFVIKVFRDLFILNLTLKLHLDLRLKLHLFWGSKRLLSLWLSFSTASLNSVVV